VYDDAVAVIAQGVVRAIGPVGEVPVPDGVEVLDLGAAVVIPGLVDAHVHLALDAGADAPAAVVGVPDEQIVARMIANARTLLAAGVTTARDLGAPLGPALAARATLAAEGALRLLVAGAPITAAGAHLHFFGGAAATAEDAVYQVRRQVAAGVDWIKLVLSGGEITPGSNPRDGALPEETVRAAVGAAREAGRPVAVHAHTAGAARLAVELGVQTVEHCTLLDGDLAHPVTPPVVCPTANRRWLAGSDSDRRARAQRLDALRRGGSRLIHGTDAGIPGVGFGAYADGLLARHEAGLDAVELVAAASSTAAAGLGLDDRGALEPGKAGDLVAFDLDPIEDVRTLRRPRAIVVGGRCVSAR
jgi:imidazolonepropionase-like amidohydrolase